MKNINANVYFRIIGTEEQNQIAEENKEFLKEYDEKIDSMTFHHLPQKNNKMEFTLVDDIKPEDLCDYAIMSGDGVEDLIIQGLFNFQTMKYNNNKVITIMLDTLSCFLGFGNITPITQYPLMKGEYRLPKIIILLYKNIQYFFLSSEYL